MHCLTEEKRHSPGGRKQKNYQAAVLMLFDYGPPHPPSPTITHHHPPPTTHHGFPTASVGDIGPSSGCQRGCVRSVSSSHMGSSSHLPPCSSQPDPYPQSSPAQQARCLIPTKRLPAGGCGGGGAGGNKGREELWELGSSTAKGPLTWSLARRGRRPRQTASCLLHAASSSSSSLFYQPHRPQGLTERQKRGRMVGKWTQWRDWHGLPWPPSLPPSLHSSLGTDLSIPHGQAAALSSSPLCDPTLFCSLLYPSTRRAPHMCGQARPYWPYIR